MLATFRQGRLEIHGVFDLTAGRGFSNLSAGLDGDLQEFLKGNPADVCATIYCLFAHPLAMLTNSWSRAVSELSLYACGAEVGMTKQQFRALERRVRDYASRMRGHCPDNEQLVRYVLKRAVKRAKQDALIGKDAQQQPTVASV